MHGILFTASLLQGAVHLCSNSGVLEHMQTKVPYLSATNFKLNPMLTNKVEANKLSFLLPQISA